MGCQSHLHDRLHCAVRIFTICCNHAASPRLGGAAAEEILECPGMPMVQQDRGMTHCEHFATVIWVTSLKEIYVQLNSNTKHCSLDEDMNEDHIAVHAIL